MIENRVFPSRQSRIVELRGAAYLCDIKLLHLRLFSSMSAYNDDKREVVSQWESDKNYFPLSAK